MRAQFITAEEVQQVLDVSRSKSYKDSVFTYAVMLSGMCRYVNH